MSRLAKEYNRALHKNNQTYAAWFPVTNTFKVGDFGLIEGGVFRSLGNIKDTFDIDFTTKDGPPSKMDFSSEGTKVIKLVGGAEVDTYPQVGTLEAKMNISFSKSNSFMVKAAEVTSVQMSNIQEVAWALVKNKRWKRSYKVVESTYTGVNCVVILASESNTTIGLTGNIEALKQVDAGNVSADIGIEGAEKSTFNSVGDSGVVALRLFKLGWRGGVKLMNESDVEIKSDFGEELEDDI